MAFSLKKALGGGGLAHNIQSALTGGASTGVSFVKEDKRVKEEREAKKKRGEVRRDEAAKEAERQRGLTETRRLGGRLGRRSTQRSRTTPDLFAGSTGQTKVLLG
jgi:hypothetical protein